MSKVDDVGNIPSGKVYKEYEYRHVMLALHIAVDFTHKLIDVPSSIIGPMIIYLWDIE